MRKRDYHQNLRLYHPDKNVNKLEAEKEQIAAKYIEFRRVIPPRKDFLGLDHEEPTITSSVILSEVIVRLRKIMTQTL